MANYRHKTSGKVVTMTKEAHKKLNPELQKKYIEVADKKKKKVATPIEAVVEETKEQE